MDGIRLPKGLDLKSLELYRDIKLRKPAPWIEQFGALPDIKKSINQRIINDLYEAMLQQEAATTSTIEALTDAFLRSDEGLRQAVMEAADPKIKAQLADFDRELEELEQQRRRLEAERGKTEFARNQLEEQVKLVTIERQKLQEALKVTIGDALAGAVSAGVKPVVLHRVAGPESLPLVTDQELAVGGIRYSGYSQRKPTLEQVTWNKTPRTAKGGAWRGYDACLQFTGKDFSPGCRIQSRPIGSDVEITGGQMPNVYSGHYMEISTNDFDETPISYLAYEFRIQNWINSSEWVRFTFSHDHDREVAIANELMDIGERALDEGRVQEAMEPLRSAMVRFTGLVGENDPRSAKARQLWNSALERRQGS